MSLPLLAVISPPILQGQFPKPYPQVAALSANQHPDGWSTEGGEGYFQVGGDLPHAGALANTSNDWSGSFNASDQFIYDRNMGNYTTARPRIPKRSMKQRKRLAKVEHPSKKQKLALPSLPIPQLPPVSHTNETDSSVSISTSEELEDDASDSESISSSDADVDRAMNGETFEDDNYEIYETSSGTSSSGTSSEASESSSPYDILRSGLTSNMLTQYMAGLSPHDHAVHLTRSYATPVGPSKKKPVMKFTPTNKVNGVDVNDFVNQLQAAGASSGENIEIDDGTASADGQYIEVDLALGVLEEKKKDDQDIAVRPGSPDISSENGEDGEDGEDVGIVNHLTNIAGNGKGVSASRMRSNIEEL